MYRWTYRGLSEIVNSVGNSCGKMELKGTDRNWLFTIKDEKGKISFYWDSNGDKMMEGEGSLRFFIKNWYATAEEFSIRQKEVFENRAEFKGRESRCQKALKASITLCRVPV